ncbi:cation transporter [Pseudogracilibacillus sp. SE30717A]|uniref:cation transporter n=1 Tax=Pseudogracilibacillus sp. SE30717A TaxID=3098293 RepID=UPI00300DE583
MDVIVEVKGMSCNHCEKTVKDTLDNINGVQHVNVHLPSGKVEVKYDQTVIDLDTICKKIEEQGYEVAR